MYTYLIVYNHMYICKCISTYVCIYLFMYICIYIYIIVRNMYIG
jgi:hypothetical protein